MMTTPHRIDRLCRSLARGHKPRHLRGGSTPEYSVPMDERRAALRLARRLQEHAGGPQGPAPGYGMRAAAHAYGINVSTLYRWQSEFEGRPYGVKL